MEVTSSMTCEKGAFFQSFDVFSSRKACRWLDSLLFPHLSAASVSPILFWLFRIGNICSASLPPPMPQGSFGLSAFYPGTSGAEAQLRSIAFHSDEAALAPALHVCSICRGQSFSWRGSTRCVFIPQYSYFFHKLNFSELHKRFLNSDRRENLRGTSNMRTDERNGRS